MSHGLLATAGLDDHAGLETVARELQLDRIRIEPTPASVMTLSERKPDCLILNWLSEAGRGVCREVRLSNSLAELVVIAVVGDPWSNEVAEAFACGVDDFLPARSLGHLRYKFIAIRSEGAPMGEYLLSGRVVLAGPEPKRRAALGRHLRKMGLDVCFAADAGDIPVDNDVKLVVADFPAAPEELSETIRAYREEARIEVPWIVIGGRNELASLKQELQRFSALRLFDVESDPAQIVFAANQMLVGEGRAMRRSPRLAFETTIRLRVSDQDGWGYTYNINRGGLYVRTLTPPAIGTELGVEFRPPMGRGRVSLDGKVVWRQEYSPQYGYPAGFGVQMAEALPADDAAMNAGYEALLERQAGGNA